MDVKCEEGTQTRTAEQLAVQSALTRKSTQEMQDNTAPDGAGGQDSEGSEDEGALASKAEMVRIKRENHARYMRFSRSLKSFTVACFQVSWMLRRAVPTRDPSSGGGGVQGLEPAGHPLRAVGYLRRRLDRVTPVPPDDSNHSAEEEGRACLADAI